MNEGTLKRKLAEKLKARLEGALIFRHEDKSIAGMPDFGVTWSPYIDRHGHTTWWEVKYDRPSSPWKLPKMPDVQELTMLRLERHATSAWYVIYHEEPGMKRVCIVQPAIMRGWKRFSHHIIDGFNHDAVVDFIEKVHRHYDSL